MQLVVAAHAVGDDLEPLARHVDRRAVGQVAAGGEVEAHEGVAGLQQRQEHRLVRLAAGVRLHVGEVAAEQLLGALDRERLGDVDELAAAVVALARIALGVFVGQHRALRLEHGAGDDVLGGDQLDLVALAAELLADGVGDLGIAFGERRGEEAGRHPAGHRPVRSRTWSASFLSAGMPPGLPRTVAGRIAHADVRADRTRPDRQSRCSDRRRRAHAMPGLRARSERRVGQRCGASDRGRRGRRCRRGNGRRRRASPRR